MTPREAARGVAEALAALRDRRDEARATVTLGATEAVERTRNEAAFALRDLARDTEGVADLPEWPRTASVLRGNRIDPLTCARLVASGAESSADDDALMRCWEEWAHEAGEIEDEATSREVAPLWGSCPAYSDRRWAV